MDQSHNNQVKDYESELLDILESNLSNKDVHVERLMSYYPDSKSEISTSYMTWKDLDQVNVPSIRPQMDDAFYAMLHKQTLSEKSDASHVMSSSSPEDTSKGILRLFSPTRLAIAATFVIGMMAGQWLDFGGPSDLDQPQPIEIEGDSQVHFASLEHTPSAMRRIQGINEVKSQDEPGLKIIDALNQVILNDPNVNVRLTAIETMVLFSDIPEARAYLIEAIPHQASPIVQLELADVMIALEEKSSADKWNQLLQSDNMETETKIHLKESLKQIL